VDPAYADVSKVDFGRLDAESDKNLHDYFVDTGAFRRMLAGERHYGIGRKGAGKTAIFKNAQTALKEIKIAPVPIVFSDYAWENHKAVRELGMTAEDSYRSSWLFTFLIAACIVWKRSAVAHVRSQADEVYRQIYKNEEVDALTALFDKLRRIRKLELPKIEGLGSLGGVELDKASEGNQLARAANGWNQSLLELAKRIFYHHPTTILVDGLDDGWDASPESKAMLVGALKAAREINLKLSVVGRPMPVVIFLRSDIFRELEFNDKNKISQDIEWLEWDDASLVEIVAARVSRSLKIPRKEAWGAVFSDQPMRQRASIRSYLLKRSMRRPRDMVAFATSCREAALGANHRIIETADVYAAEKAYSKHIHDELVDEMHKQTVNHGALFQALVRVGYSRFRFEDWRRAVCALIPGFDADKARRALRTLFDNAIVGITKVGGAGGGSVVEYVYDDRFHEPTFEGEMAVHPSLLSHLKIKDRRTDDGEEVAEG
jgi:hypothetical protein